MPRLLADTAPLANEHFRRLWFANIVTVIGAQLTVVAVPAQIYAITGSSGYVGLAGLFGLVPLVLFGLYGGALADHLDKRVLLVISTLGLIATSGLFFVQAVTGNRNVWILLDDLRRAAGVLRGQPAGPHRAAAPDPRPARAVAGRQLAEHDRVRRWCDRRAPRGGRTHPPGRLPWLYFIDTVTLTATLYAVWRLPVFLPASGSTGAKAPGFAAVVDGFRYLARDRVVLMSFVVDIIAMVFGMPRALFPALAHLSFGGPVTGGLAFALLYASIPTGSVVGGVFSGWVSRVDRHGRATVVAVAVWGGSVVLFGLIPGKSHGHATPWLWLAFLAMAVAGGADMISSAFRQTILLSASAENIRGRLQGVFIVVVAGGPRVADVVHGGAAALWGNATVTTAGGLLVIVGVLLASAAVPAFWRYRASRTPAPAAVARES